jgi:hypothetical protein
LVSAALDLRGFCPELHPRAVAEYDKPDVAISPKNIDIALYFSLDNERCLGLNLRAIFGKNRVVLGKSDLLMSKARLCKTASTSSVGETP